jgi:hypothetical protein
MRSGRGEDGRSQRQRTDDLRGYDTEHAVKSDWNFRGRGHSKGRRDTHANDTRASSLSENKSEEGVLDVEHSADVLPKAVSSQPRCSQG